MEEVHEQQRYFMRESLPIAGSLAAFNATVTPTVLYGCDGSTVVYSSFCKNKRCKARAMSVPLSVPMGTGPAVSSGSGNGNFSTPVMSSNFSMEVPPCMQESATTDVL